MIPLIEMSEKAQLYRLTVINHWLPRLTVGGEVAGVMGSDYYLIGSGF